MGRRGQQHQRAAVPWGTLPRCGRLVSYPHNVSHSCLHAQFAFLPFVQATVTLAFASSLGIPLEVKWYLCSSWEQCLSTSSREKVQEAPKSNNRKQLIMKTLYLEVLSKIS